MSEPIQNTISIEDRANFCRTFFKMKEQDMLLYYILSLPIDSEHNDSYYTDFLDIIEDVHQSKTDLDSDWNFDITLIFKYKGVEYKIVESYYIDDIEFDEEVYGIHNKPVVSVKRDDVWCDVDSSCPKIIRDIKYIAEHRPFMNGCK